MLTVLLVLLATILGLQSVHAEPLNAIVGDASWHATHLGDPDHAPEVERIRTHLRWVADRLEATDVSHLSTDARHRRRSALRHLRTYAAAGRFPRRTHDGFPGRRPRFIDDRGVHCAVGELIRHSGHPELARTIRDRWEYAYVLEIDHPPLARWAQRHGFTATELATIQPGYSSPPTKRSVRHDIERLQELLVLSCERDADKPRRITIDVKVDRHGEVSAGLHGSPSPYGRCIGETLHEHSTWGRGAWDRTPTAFRTKVRLELERPSDIVRRRIDELHLFDTPCVPRPGPLAREATFRFLVDDRGTQVTVHTSPPNPEVAACLEQYARDRLHGIPPGPWKVRARRASPLRPEVTADQLGQSLPGWVRRAGVLCHDLGAPEVTRVRLTTVIDARAPTILLEGGTSDFRTCMETHLQQRFRQTHTVAYPIAPGEGVTLFRIDDAVTVELDVPLETPEAAEAREQRAQREIEDPPWDP